MKKTLKRVLALALAGTMACSLAACGGSGDGDKGNAGNKGDADATYTYNSSLTTFPTNWNPHTYQTATDAEILDYITEGFYVFDYNETKDGYQLVPGTAAGDPVDVTADYVGKFGIEEGDAAKAWEIPLRSDLAWEDGTPITAEDFVTSAKLLLNPEAGNYRADSLYSGNMTVVNAKDYLYSGKYAYETDLAADGAVTDLVKDADGYYTTADGNYIAAKLSSSGIWGSNSLEEYGAAGYFVGEDGTDAYETISAAADAEGIVKINDEILAILDNFCKTNGGGYENEWQELCFIGQQFDEIDFSEVGIFATADDKLVLVLEKPLEGFYLLYSLTSSWLVNEALYTECESVTDGVYNNTYGTSAETTMSYGPFKLASFQADKQYVLERNEYHHAVKEGFYQTTTWQVDYIAEASTRLEYFLKGDLDSYVLTVEDMEAYQASDYTYFAEGASTFFVALNPNKAALETAQKNLGDNYNKTILTVLEFRQALSFALDRNAFALAADPMSSPAFGVFSSQIISDPDNGIAYRTTDEAKMVLAKFWGVDEEIGEGKTYADLDEAVNSITGYNLEKAKVLFDAAYDKAIEEGLMDEDDIIEIKIGTPNATSQAYAKGYEFLTNCYTDAVKGTKLEGKLTFSLDNTLGNGFADALRSNQVDMLFFVGWSGSALDPYGLMEAYTSTDYQYDPSWDTTAAQWEIELSDGKYTASVWDWTATMAGETITITAEDGTTKEFSCGTADKNPEDRFAILAGLEGAVLSTYDMIPLTGNAQASLKGMQVSYYSEEYVYGVGFHGMMKYLTYNYTDAEWADFVSEHGGSLEYK